MELSATQIKKFRDCERLIGFEYNEHIKPLPTDKQQFGSDVHKQLENWFRKGKAPDRSAPGQVAASGLKWLPTPDRSFGVEKKFELQWLPSVFMIGYVDLAVPSDRLVIDHKSTSDLRWAMTTEQLATDPQAIIYAVWGMVEWQVNEVTARWVYYAASNPKTGARKPRGCKPIECSFNSKEQSFMSLVGQITKDSRRIVEIRRSGEKGLELKASPGSCGNFGGCPHRELCDLPAESSIDRYFT